MFWRVSALPNAIGANSSPLNSLRRYSSYISVEMICPLFLPWLAFFPSTRSHLFTKISTGLYDFCASIASCWSTWLTGSVASTSSITTSARSTASWARS